MAQTYYIFRSGRLKRGQNTLYLEQENDDGQVQRQPIPVENVRDLCLFGEIDLNTKLLSFLAQSEIVFHCFNYYGFHVGSFYPRESNVSGHLLVRQVEHYILRPLGSGHTESVELKSLFGEKTLLLEV